jgi:RNA polymerase sigma factor (sigma-70 family)
VKNLLNDSEDSLMLLLIQGCKRQERESQRLLYQHYFGYAMSICVRYCKSYDEAKEVLNDGFLKVFTKIDQYHLDTSFNAWLRRIMINSAIDHYRRERKHYNHISTDDAVLPQIHLNGAIEELSYGELMGLVQRLSPGYRAVFNLYVIDGYNHEEIGKMLGISTGTSKSNLMKARANLKKMLQTENYEQYAKYI